MATTLEELLQILMNQVTRAQRAEARVSQLEIELQKLQINAKPQKEGKE